MWGLRGIKNLSAIKKEISANGCNWVQNAIIHENFRRHLAERLMNKCATYGSNSSDERVQHASDKAINFSSVQATKKNHLEKYFPSYFYVVWSLENKKESWKKRFAFHRAFSFFFIHSMGLWRVSCSNFGVNVFRLYVGRGINQTYILRMEENSSWSARCVLVVATCIERDEVK